MEEAVKYILGRLEGFMKFKNIGRPELATMEENGSLCL